jgi:hypothetical protein
VHLWSEKYRFAGKVCDSSKGTAMDDLRLHFVMPSSGYLHPMPNLHRFTSIVTLRQYQPTLKLHRFTFIFNLHINSITSPYLQFNPTPKLHRFLVPPMSTLHLNSVASRYLCVCVCVCVCVCLCVCTVRSYGRTVHTHHRFKITLPNTDQAHDKISMNHY